MTSVAKGFVYGAAAGAAGTAALNTVSYADMVLRARPASTVPAAVVAAAADRVSVDVPGRRADRANRVEALGGLAGLGAGVLIGAVAGAARAAGLRLPGVIAGPLLGAGAMVATDVPSARLGVTDPRTWSPADWTSDALPHLTYGFVTHAVLDATSHREPGGRDDLPDAGERRPPTPGLLVRAIALGAATGSRSSAGLTALALRSSPRDAGLAGRLARPGGRVVLPVLAAAELAMDKSSSVPSRLSPQGAVPRITLGAAAGAALAHRDGSRGTAAAIAGAAGAIGAALLGHRLRVGTEGNDRTRLTVAVLEDAAAAALAWLGTRRGRRRTPSPAAARRAGG